MNPIFLSANAIFKLYKKRWDGVRQQNLALAGYSIQDLGSVVSIL